MLAIDIRARLKQSIINIPLSVFQDFVSFEAFQQADYALQGILILHFIALFNVESCKCVQQNIGPSDAVACIGNNNV